MQSCFLLFRLAASQSSRGKKKRREQKKKAVSNLSTGPTSTALEQAKQTHIKTHDDYSLLFSVFFFFEKKMK